MESTYVDSYKEQLSDVFSEIIRIDTNFNSLKKKAMSDFEAGLIDKEVYTEVVYATYKRPLSARAREYAISEEERLLVLKYGQFMSNGDLSLAGLDDTYKDITGRMDSVGNSVKKYYEYYNLSLEELRAKVLEFVSMIAVKNKEDIFKKINDLEKKLLDIKPELRNKSVEQIEINQLKKEFKKIEENEKTVVNCVLNADHDALMKYICSKFKLEERFYKWYRVRKTKEKIANREHSEVLVDGLNDSRVAAIACKENLNTSSELINHIVEINQWISDFAVASSNVTNDIGRRNIIGKFYTKEECFRLFKKFYSIETFLNYLPSFLDYDNGLSDSQIFTIFYLENFLDSKKVDPDRFRITLIKSVLDYYKQLVSKYSILLKEIISKSANNIDSVLEHNISVTKNVILVRDIVSDIIDDKDYLEGYLSNEEEEQLYESLNLYFEMLEKSKQEKVLEYGKKQNN